MTCGAAMKSMSRNSLILRSWRSGAASWMKSAADAMTARSVVKDSVPAGPTPGPSSFLIDGQATSTAARSRASAAGDTS